MTRPRICDFCHWYAFNGDEQGAWAGDGRCEHPSHPRAAEPDDCCEDWTPPPTVEQFQELKNALPRPHADLGR